jgi:molybdate transport system substrate-binding protein
MKFARIFLLTSLLFAPDAFAEKITVFAASSLTDVMVKIIQTYNTHSETKIETSYASSGLLAKQIENGAPADLFISADEKWVDYLTKKTISKANLREDLIGNELVLITPIKEAVSIKFDPQFNLEKAIGSHLCTGEVSSVPVGIYAKEALSYFGWWESVKAKIVGAQDVRAALNFVASGECPMGIVYASDAAASSKVKVIGIFPEISHSPIRYPAIALNNQPETIKFFKYLQSPEAKQIFIQFGFKSL